MPPNPTISVSLLKKHNACEEQITLFEEFLNGRDQIEVTPDVIRQARKCGLAVEWLADKIDLPRETICADASLAFCYARDVEACPHDDTRAAACLSPEWAYNYARYVDKYAIDKSILDDTRAACQEPKWAFYYARGVDKCPRDDTRTIACLKPKYAHYYALYVDACPHDETRVAACQDSQWAYNYARYVDKCPRDDTRAGASTTPGYAHLYADLLDHSFQPSYAWHA